MEVRIVLRSLIFYFLIAISQLSVVCAGQDSTTSTHLGGSQSLDEPSSVKDILDLLGKVGTFKKKGTVVDCVDKSLQQYLITKEIHGKTLKNNFDGLFKKIAKLRKNLLKDPRQYGKYSEAELSESDTEASVNLLIKWLPILHSELYFLYFQTSRQCATIHGGAWRKQKFGPSHSTTQLHRWLMSKGFQPDELHDKNSDKQITGSTAVSHSQSGHLNRVQYGLFFLSPWHDSNLASVVRFLQEFCTLVNKEDGAFLERVNGQKTDPLKSACGQLSIRLVFLIDTLRPLYYGSIDTYRGKLKADALGLYLEWLRRNLDGIIVSMGQMLYDSEHWTKDAFANARSPGPFKYGFVFKDSDWDFDSFQSQLKAAIDCLIGPVSDESLQKLKERIDKITKGESPEVSTTMGTLRDLAGSLEGLKTSDGTAQSSGDL